MVGLFFETARQTTFVDSGLSNPYHVGGIA